MLTAIHNLLPGSPWLHSGPTSLPKICDWSIGTSLMLTNAWAVTTVLLVSLFAWLGRALAHGNQLAHCALRRYVSQYGVKGGELDFGGSLDEAQFSLFR